MTDVNGRPLRKDAERNRQRLLVAATELFAQRGLDVDTLLEPLPPGGWPELVKTVL